ncbi:NAD-dependent epimerase/dehydratase family protein [Kribbella sp. NPDC004875]|uniref:NAD-dependent epimerase/dehydratase family protein n=1 Tax=Kribbella sp. NPDC004875 TaxID=3364107 RepID=UPI00367BBF49
MTGHVLVTGARGAIGSAISENLHQAGATVTALDVAPIVTAEPYQQLVGDVRDLAAMTAALYGVDAIVHCGGLPSDRKGREYDTYDINIAGTCTLLLAAARAGVPRIVHLSSINALGCVGAGTPAYLPVDDDHPHTPTSPYQLSKHLSEEACRQFADRHDATVMSLRPTYVIHKSSSPGPGVADLYAYVDIRDVVRAIRSALTVDLTGFHTALLAADDLWGGRLLSAVLTRDYDQIPWHDGNDPAPHTSLVNCANARSLLDWTPRFRHATAIPSA